MAFATGGLFFQERRVGMAFSERAYARILVFQRFGFRRYLHRHLFYSTKYPPNESRRKAVRQKRTPSASRLSRRPSGEALWGISWNMIMGYEPTVKPCTRLPLADPSQGKRYGRASPTNGLPRMIVRRSGAHARLCDCTCGIMTWPVPAWATSPSSKSPCATTWTGSCPSFPWNRPTPRTGTWQDFDSTTAPSVRSARLGATSPSNRRNGTRADISSLH